MDQQASWAPAQATFISEKGNRMASELAKRRLPTFWMLKNKLEAPRVGKSSGLLVGVCLLLSTVLLFPGNAWAQSEPNTDSPAWLASFPSPDKVRADVVASADDAEPEVIEGQAAWVSTRHGNGTIHLFGFSPHFRAWTQQTMHLLFRALFVP